MNDEVATLQCKECSIPLDTKALHFGEDYNKILRDKQLCFSCNFWTEYVEQKYDPNIARIDGAHYMIGDEKASSIGRGFAGRRFVILFFRDGLRVSTTNLWHQGIIPDHFRDRLTDNAEFVRVKS